MWYRDDVRTSAYNDVRSVSAPNKERTDEIAEKHGDHLAGRLAHPVWPSDGPVPQGELCLQRRPSGPARHRGRGWPVLAARVTTRPDDAADTGRPLASCQRQTAARIRVRRALTHPGGPQPPGSGLGGRARREVYRCASGPSSMARWIRPPASSGTGLT